MSPTPSGVVACQGAPRDLGMDQGRALRAPLRAALRDLPLVTRMRAGWLLRGAARTAQSARDALRYFPHMAERQAGLARGAGVGRGALAALLARELSASACGGGATAIVAGAERTGAPGPLLARTLPLAGGLFVRRSAPEHDLPSLEIAMPWLVPALAGVNQGGLAVAALVHEPAPGSCVANAAPALLLAQDCLQRFDTVQKAIEWCERRPSGGSAALLLADAAGDVVEIRLQGRERTLRRARDGILASAGEPTRAAELEKALAAEARPSPTALARALGAEAPSVVLDPATRTLEIGGIRLKV